jgi:predicted nuclease of predicted toxin-antitoxin system
VRLLLDANLSPRLVDVLIEAGHTVRHVVDLDLATASDDKIFTFAAEHQLVVVTADSDFSMLLVARGAASPSVVLLRHVAELTWDVHVALLIDNLAAVAEDLEAGAVVSLSPVRMSVRRLPIAPSERS